MKTQKILLIIAIISCLFAIACSNLEVVNIEQAYLYVNKGATLYEYISDTQRGDSIGTADKPKLSPFNQYILEYSTSKKYWKYEYNNKLYYLYMNSTSWVNTVADDSLSKFGKLIVKTIILEGDKPGQNKVEMRMLNLGPDINKSGVDYAPTISADGKTLYYVSNRQGSKEYSLGMPSHDFWAAKKEDKYDSVFSMPYNIDTTEFAGINTKLNEGVATIAADERTLFFTGCNRANGFGSCDIYSAKIFEGKWSKPKNLGSNVNSSYWETQPTVSPDGKVLYFVSNRPGPNGICNNDIWYSIWDESEEEWGPALNLSPLNTKGSEFAPFIAPDGVTMFFSSDGYDSTYGGLDFYVTKYDEETRTWSKPAHLQAPLNSPADDQFISLPASGDMIYYSSKRQDISGYQGDLDIFMAYVESYFRAIVLKIYVADDSHTNTSTYVTVDNPTSNRRVRERTTERDNVLSMVLTNADYGRVNDSLQFVDLKIQAENDKFGKKQKIMRVTNPLRASNKGGWVFNSELDETFEMSVSPELDKHLRSLKRSILDAKVQAYSNDKNSIMDSSAIIIEEFQSTNTTPILPYFFFDHNSAQISERYIQLSKDETIGFSVEKLDNKRTLPTYYQLLNIIGSRMKLYKDAKLTLTGCNSNSDEEKGNIELSKQRAVNIKNYLALSWEIDTSRIVTDVRNLPDKPSNGQTIEGVEENRRVECTVTDDRILVPVTTNEILKVAKPETINFKSSVSVKGGEATWRLNVMQNDKILKYFEGEGPMNKDLLWNINAEKETMPTTENSLKIELLVKDKNRDKTIVAKGEIPVKQITTKLKNTEFTVDKRIDKYSLILFDFGQSTLGKNNVGLIQYIKDNVQDNSKFLLLGYSDRIGNDSYNLKLSEKRAIETANAFGVRDLEIHAIGEGKLLYNNDIPEGRFYCRTVEIIVETPIKTMTNEVLP